MTDYGQLLLLAFFLPILGFAIGVLWNEAEHQLKEEEERK